MNTTSSVLDVNGVEIVIGSIVGFLEEDFFNKEPQGIVILPYSEFEGDEYTVPVYFFPEHDQYNHHYSQEGEKWKKKFSDKRKSGEIDFLFEDDNWKQCPFVEFFKPTNIRVDQFWSVRTLAKRYFNRFHHTVYSLPKGVERYPSLYQCFLEGCSNQASTMFLYNYWGSVYPMHICAECMDSKFDGKDRIAGESMPELNRPFKLLDGTPVTH